MVRTKPPTEKKMVRTKLPTQCVKNPGSKPPKWNHNMALFSMFFASEGYTEKEIATKLDVHIHTINYWKRTKPTFLKALEKGKDEYTNRVEKSLLENAVGYTHPAIHFSVIDDTVIQTPYLKHYPPNVTAQIFYLKNRARDRWMDVHKIEGEVNHRHVLDLTSYSDEQLSVLETVGLTKELPEHGSDAG